MGFPGAVIHDPDTDWCACEPDGDRRCDYRMLADAVIRVFNPPDGDEAEVGICITAVEAAYDYIGGQPCTCVGNHEDEVCIRCSVLGERQGRLVDR